MEQILRDVHNLHQQTVTEAKAEVELWRLKVEKISLLRERLSEKYLDLQKHLSDVQTENKHLKSVVQTLQKRGDEKCGMCDQLKTTLDAVKTAYQQGLEEKDKLIQYLEARLKECSGMPQDAAEKHSVSLTTPDRHSMKGTTRKHGSCPDKTNTQSPDSTSLVLPCKSAEASPASNTSPPGKDKPGRLRLQKGVNKRSRYTEKVSPETKRQKTSVTETNTGEAKGCDNQRDKVVLNDAEVGQGVVLVPDTCDLFANTSILPEGATKIPGTQGKETRPRNMLRKQRLGCSSNNGGNPLNGDNAAGTLDLIHTVPETMVFGNDSYDEDDDSDVKTENTVDAVAEKNTVTEASKQYISSKNAQTKYDTEPLHLREGKDSSDSDTFISPSDEELNTQETVKAKSPKSGSGRSVLTSPVSQIPGEDSDSEEFIDKAINHKTLNLSGDGCVFDSDVEVEGDDSSSQFVRRKKLQNVSRAGSRSLQIRKKQARASVSQSESQRWVRRSPRKPKEERSASKSASDSSFLSRGSYSKKKLKQLESDQTTSSQESSSVVPQDDKNSTDLDVTVAPPSFELQRTTNSEKKAKKTNQKLSSAVLDQLRSPSVISTGRDKELKENYTTNSDVIIISSPGVGSVSDPESPLLLQKGRSGRSLSLHKEKKGAVKVNSACGTSTCTSGSESEQTSSPFKNTRSRLSQGRSEQVGSMSESSPRSNVSSKSKSKTHSKGKHMGVLKFASEKTRASPKQLCQTTLTQKFFQSPDKKSSRSMEDEKEEADIEKAIRLSLEEAKNSESGAHEEFVEKENSPPFKIPTSVVNQGKRVHARDKRSRSLASEMRDLDETCLDTSVETLREESQVLCRLNRGTGHRSGEDHNEERSQMLNGSLDPAANLSEWCQDSEATEAEERLKPVQSLPSLDQDFRIEDLHKGDNPVPLTSTLAEEDSQDIPCSSRSYKFGTKRKTRTYKHRGKENDDKPKVQVAPVSLEDSFDVRPKKSSPQYAHVAVVRKRDERQKLKGYSCKECYEYYKSKGLSEAEIQKQIQDCSRHRAKHLPPDTPPHFWSLGFMDTQECQAEENLNDDELVNAGPSKFRRKRRLMKHFKSKNENSMLEPADIDDLEEDSQPVL